MGPSSSSEQAPMEERMSLAAYLGTPETTRPRELAYGLLREPATPNYVHQLVAGRLFRRLDAHVRRRNLGQVVAAPIDVILDPDRALVVQPDLLFVSHARADRCRDRIWGAPDLVVEVLSDSTRRHDSTTKLAWYRQYGVQECWLVDPVGREVVVHEFPDRIGTFLEDAVIQSGVLPRLGLRARRAFEG
jgi:Uma2 family endonuclease